MPAVLPGEVLQRAPTLPQPKPAPAPPVPVAAAPPTPQVAGQQTDVVLISPATKPPPALPGETIAIAPSLGSKQPPTVVTTAPPVPATPPAIVQPAPAPSTPSPTAPDLAAGSDGDFAAAQSIADANAPDLADLPDWTLEDPFDTRALAGSNPPLKGGSALQVIAQACSDYGVDPRACVANAIKEGASGKIGDGGDAYGPFQIHLTDGRLKQFDGKGPNDPKINAWAWSANGLQYAVRGMVNGRPSAKGLYGHAAVYAIVYGFEKPADKRAAYNARAAEYDTLVGLGSAWGKYAAQLLAGPVSGGAKDTSPVLKLPTGATGAAGSQSAPAGVQKGWAGIIDFYSTGVPKHSDAVHSFAKSLVNTIKGG